MSVTSLLASQDSWLNSWLAERVKLPAALRFTAHHNALLSAAFKKGLQGSRAGDPRKTGMAFTYAVRYWADSRAWLDTAACRYGHPAIGLSREQVAQGVSALIAVLDKQPPERKAVTVAAAAVLMADLDEMYRAGRSSNGIALALVSSSHNVLPLVEAQIKEAQGTVQDVEALYHCVSVALGTASPAPISGLTLSSAGQLAKVRLESNPAFANSSAVGGADAQMIMGHTLFDIRTSWKAQPMEVNNLYQQIVYYLLDEYDEYQITHLAWYYSRHNAVFCHPIERLMSSPDSLRQEFSEMLEERLHEDFSEWG